MKIYTKTGDDGTTGLQGDIRVLKSDPRIMAYGAIDEANAVIGLALSHDMDEEIGKILTNIQNDLFVVGADLSNPDMENTKNRVTKEMVENLEKMIDKYELELEPLKNFILPGGDTVASQIHLARSVIRRAESQMVIVNQSEQLNENCKKYVNRVSDFLFVLARLINKRKGKKDVIWKP